MSDLSSGVSRLSLKNDRGNPPKPKKPPVVADSWEDEDVSSGSEAEEPSAGTESKGTVNPGTAAPPPTPITANYTSRPFSPQGVSVPESATYGGHDGPPVEKARPEKTDAVARRMIASALGVKVPKMTEEQRAYDKAMKEKERKRREEEKARDKQREEEAAKARAAVWDD